MNRPPVSIGTRSAWVKLGNDAEASADVARTAEERGYLSARTQRGNRTQIQYPSCVQISVPAVSVSECDTGAEPAQSTARQFEWSADTSRMPLQSGGHRSAYPNVSIWRRNPSLSQARDVSVFSGKRAPKAAG